MITVISSTKGITDGPSAYWRQRLAVQPSKSSKTMKARYTLGIQKHGAMLYLIADTHLMDGQSSWWTKDLRSAQYYYNEEVAFGKAGILSSIIDQPVEVVAVDE